MTRFVIGGTLHPGLPAPGAKVEVEVEVEAAVEAEVEVGTKSWAERSNLVLRTAAARNMAETSLRVALR